MLSDVDLLAVRQRASSCSAKTLAAANHLTSCRGRAHECGANGRSPLRDAKKKRSSRSCATTKDIAECRRDVRSV